MVLAINLQDPDNWDSVGSYTWIKGIADGDIIINPIGKVSFPFLFHSPCIAVLVEVTQPSINTENWAFGGKCLISVSTGLTLGGNHDSTIKTKSVFLKTINLIIYSDYAGDYSLQYIPPKWFNQVNLSVFAYQGDGIPDIESKLNAIGSGVEVLVGSPLTG